MSTMHAVQVSDAGGDFEIVERSIPTPAPNEARFRTVLTMEH